MSLGLLWWLSGKEFHLPMQETRVPRLDREDPVCRNNCKPACLTAHAPQCKKLPMMRSQCTTMMGSPCSLQLEKNPHSNEDPIQPKIKSNYLIKNLKMSPTELRLPLGRDPLKRGKTALEFALTSPPPSQRAAPLGVFRRTSENNTSHWQEPGKSIHPASIASQSRKGIRHMIAAHLYPLINFPRSLCPRRWEKSCS